MKSINACASACKYCRHYQLEGSRGGTCQMLNVSVKASWKACSLAVPVFAVPWETLEDAWNLPNLPVLTPTVSTVNLNSDSENLTPATPQVVLV
jgi:hypothetical protein